MNKASKSSLPLVWHYTVGRHAAKIMAARIILPENLSAVPDAYRPDEKPVTWFSARPTYEPTARKKMRNGLGKEITDPVEYEVAVGGYFRFGIPQSMTLKWRQACAQSKTPQHFRLALEKSGRKRGADPSDWYGILGPVMLSDIVSIEKWVVDHWESVEVPTQ